LDDAVRRELDRGQVIDITTIGRRTGEPRRIEIVFHVIDGRVWISGMPRKEPRAWLVNLQADPHLTLHLKERVVADLPATARIVDDPDERRHILASVAANWGRDDLDIMVAYSPLIEVVVDGYATA
jgi:deazaflavin-dependent oxidoreductase (nitroreductase family)